MCRWCLPWISPIYNYIESAIEASTRTLLCDILFFFVAIKRTIYACLVTNESEPKKNIDAGARVHVRHRRSACCCRLLSAANRNRFRFRINQHQVSNIASSVYRLPSQSNRHEHEHKVHTNWALHALGQMAMKRSAENHKIERNINLNVRHECDRIDYDAITSKKFKFSMNFSIHAISTTRSWLASPIGISQRKNRKRNRKNSSAPKLCVAFFRADDSSAHSYRS